MKKVNIFFLAIILVLSLIALPFSATSAEMTDGKSLEKVARSIAVKKCDTILEDEFSKFINYVKYMESGSSCCYDCKKGIVLEGQRGNCRVRINKAGPDSYVIK